jgi:hypothetical protein
MSRVGGGVNQKLAIIAKLPEPHPVTYAA